MPERASLRAGMLVPALFLTEEAGTGQWDTHQPDSGEESGLAKWDVHEQSNGYSHGFLTHICSII